MRSENSSASCRFKIFMRVCWTAASLLGTLLLFLAWFVLQTLEGNGLTDWKWLWTSLEVRLSRKSGTWVNSLLQSSSPKMRQISWNMPGLTGNHASRNTGYGGYSHYFKELYKPTARWRSFGSSALPAVLPAVWQTRWSFSIFSWLQDFSVKITSGSCEAEVSDMIPRVHKKRKKKTTNQMNITACFIDIQ